MIILRFFENRAPQDTCDPGRAFAIAVSLLQHYFTKSDEIFNGVTFLIAIDVLTNALINALIQKL